MFWWLLKLICLVTCLFSLYTSLFPLVNQNWRFCIWLWTQWVEFDWASTPISMTKLCVSSWKLIFHSLVCDRMEPHSDSSEPQVRDISTEDSENQNNHAVDVLELGESPDSAWTPLSTSNTTFDSSQPEMLNEEAECVDTKDDNLPCVLTKTKPKHKWYAVKELGLR